MDEEGGSALVGVSGFVLVGDVGQGNGGGGGAAAAARGRGVEAAAAVHRGLGRETLKLILCAIRR